MGGRMFVAICREMARTKREWGCAAALVVVYAAILWALIR